jgi:hypothetical protein
MKIVVSTFSSIADAHRAAQQLRSMRVSEDRINFLTPGTSPTAVPSVPTTEAEPPGTGTAIGGVVGSAVGIATGLPLGALVASAFIPGVGAVVAVGVLAGAVLGLGGAAIGSAMEGAVTDGLPKDELFFYEEALRRGHTVVIVQAEDDDQADQVRDVFMRAGAESLDAARDRWWLGLRGAEEAAYAQRGGAFRAEETLYRLGFETALAPDVRDRSGEALEAALRARHGDACEDRAFRAGLARGREYHRRLREQERLARSA